MTDNNIIRFLPSIFNTSTEKKFFDATFDQVFSKSDNETLSAFIGRRVGNHYNPVTDYYITEPTKDRTWWQLESTAFSRDTDNAKTNIFFYDDLLNKINYYGGNTLNQDRLFASKYYSWCPPINPDMFVNYQNYYWVDQRLPAITITGAILNPVTAADILGQESYTTPSDASPPDLKLSSGMRIILTQDPDYSSPHTVDNTGEQGGGLRLVADLPDDLLDSEFEFIPWDGIVELSTGRTIDGRFWDSTPWEVQSVPFVGDYITISRSSSDQNAWSRTNKWYHIDVITETMVLTNTSFPAVATRALRPIIQFNADLQLYGSGTTFKTVLKYAYTEYSPGSPVLLSDVQGQALSFVNNLLQSNLKTGDLVVFFNDSTMYSSPYTVKETIFSVNIQFGLVTFTTLPDFVVDNDIVLIDTSSDLPDNPSKLESWYYVNSNWQKVSNDKFKANQSPLFQLYDHNYADLESYNDNDFAGNYIFSYKVNPTPGAFVDPVLKFPIVYTSLGQASDIVFENNLMVDRYKYESGSLPISGYYYFKYSTYVYPVIAKEIKQSFGNSWNPYSPSYANETSIVTSRQRVVDRYVVGYNTSGPQIDDTYDNILRFKLSVYPFNYPTDPDIIVAVNGTILKTSDYTFDEINTDLYLDLSVYLAGWQLSPNTVPPVVEAFTYTHDELNPLKPGYSEIPQQLEANPNNDEIFETTGSNLTDQFVSIIRSQEGFNGTAFGGSNNYRDSALNISLGNFILQNECPLLKTMLVSDSGDLEYINALRFSSNEYTKFKVKYLRTAQQLINQNFTPLMIHDNDIVIGQWVDQIFKTINISKEFSNAFAYSFMVAASKVFAEETDIVPAASIDPNYSLPLTLTYHVDITDPKNVIYMYNVSNNKELLLIDRDYILIQNNPLDPIEVIFNITNGSSVSGDTIDVQFYQNPLPTYIPSTPSKLGTYQVYEPRLEIDYTYADPILVIVGHDGSRTVTKGDYTDQLILELEKRIYNGIPAKFRNQYNMPLVLEQVKSGFFRETRYSREDYLTITESYLNKWSAKYSADYRLNEYDQFSQNVPANKQWMLWNYTSTLTNAMQPSNLPGNWKGIFDLYYDTIRPDIAPWEMLGFSEEPDWWVEEYGFPVINTNGQFAWTSISNGFNILYNDLEDGIIRRGPRATFDPDTGSPLPNMLWARPGLSAVLPVDINGDIRTVVDIFDLLWTSDPYNPFDGFKDNWVYGDGSPVEQAWYNSSEYAYSTNEFLYLMNPASTGQFYFDTIGTEYSPNHQYVQNEKYLPYNFYVQVDDYFANGDAGSGDPYFSWMRPKNNNQIVHAEILPDNSVTIRFGYQCWISDYLMFLGKDVTSSFGHRVRNLNVNLANKFAGFTNKDTVRVYLESISPNSSTLGLLVPTNNFEVRMHVGQPIATYSYSGVIVRALADGTFAVYGYDLLNPEFTVFARRLSNAQQLTIGGTPASWINFQSGSSYSPGTIVRYNGVYYQNKVQQINVVKFDPLLWEKLAALPIVGGVSVTYYPKPSTEVIKIAYGTVFSSAQEVFNFLLGWGDFLAFSGWKFEDINKESNEVSDWLYSAKQFLFWINTSWAPDASIQLSPLANSATLQVSNGYPMNVEKISNGVYSILDKFGVAINPRDTTIERNNQLITVIPTTLAAGGIYYLQVSAAETEHVLMFDNTTSFNDTIYSPLYRDRQERLKFTGFRSRNWFGKMEAPGYLILDNQLLPNYDTMVSDVKYFYDPNVIIDNPSAEALGRHLIGYDSKSFLDNLEIGDDIQYLFYQGMIRQKGTRQAFNKLFRSSAVVGNRDYSDNERINVYEEWALKLGDFGNTIEQVTTEFKLKPEQYRSEVIVARLNYVPDRVGFVRMINILNAQNIYSAPPKILVDAPDSTARGTATISSGDINEIVLTNAGENYNSVPSVTITGDGVGATALAHIEYGSISYVEILTTGSGYTYATVEFGLPDGARTSTAYAILDSTGRISRIDIADQGAGYTSNPSVTIVPNLGNVDSLYAIYQGEIIRDEKIDNIIEIDIDDTDVWTVRPPEPSYSLVFPTTDQIYYNMPDAGYANRNDVGWLTFDSVVAHTLWGTTQLNPKGGDTVWIADDQDSDWDILKLVSYNETITESHWDVSLNSWDHIDFPEIATGTSTIVSGAITHISVTAGGGGYISNPLVSITGDGVGATATATISNGSVTQIMITSAGTGYTFANITIDPSPTLNNASASAVISNGVVNAVQIVLPGESYIYPPTVSFSGGNGQGAFAVATINNGIVTGVTVTYGGSGYTSAPDVTFSPPQITDKMSILWDEGFEIIADEAGQLTLSVIDKDSITNNDFSSICLQNIETGNATPISNYLTNVSYIGPRTENRQITNTDASVSTTYDVIITWYDFALTNREGVPLTVSDIVDYVDINKLYVFKTMRFSLTPISSSLPYYIHVGDKIWVDVNENNKWAVYNVIVGQISTDLELFREQTKLIQTRNFHNTQIFREKNQQELVLLPVYDPFKGILPNLAEQNITYKSFQDPARYNITSDPRLYSQNKTFGPAQVGQLWWDFTDCRYFYYEQPIALNGSETENSNLTYTRDNWGQLFPGSVISIYEWVESAVPPSDYTGPGTPRSLVDSVQITSYNSFTNIIESRYYFWVKNATNQPNLQNRTLPAIDVARLLQNPKTQGYMFFAPVQQTLTSNSYMFYNVSDILAYKGNNVQIQYQVSDRDDQIHTQWGLYREGDVTSTIPSSYWDKFVDSICAYTDTLPVTGKYNDSILIYNTSTLSFDKVLPVPDPGLSVSEKYGVTYRPRQGMFVNIFEARKVFYQAVNSLLINIPIRDLNPDWDAGVDTNTYWRYVNWYKVGFENVVPQVQYTTLLDASVALAAGELALGEIVKVLQGTVAANPADYRYALYAVTSVANTSAAYLQLVGYELSAVQVLPTIYTVKNVYGLSVELRQLLNAFNTQVFTEDFVIDTNLLFFAMTNYVLSEQQNPNWVFKSSYIYIKEENIQLTQSNLYVPDQIENIIGYINDVKPYHTQIRDYIATYVLEDTAYGTASDILQHQINIKFEPNYNTFVNNTNLFNAETYADLLDNLTDGGSPFSATDEFTANYDSGKLGYSALYPYTFVLPGNPYNVPANIFGITANGVDLDYGYDYYVEQNDSTSYTAYLFSDPGVLSVTAYILVDAGGYVQTLPVDPDHNELAFGAAIDNLVINVDVALPMNIDSTYFGLWDSTGPDNTGWDNNAAVNGGWDNGIRGFTGVGSDGSFIIDPVLIIVDTNRTISYKENLGSDNFSYYRNNSQATGILSEDLTSSEIISFNINSSDVFPATGSVWVGSELIGYTSKTYLTGVTTFIGLTRGLNGTPVSSSHPANIEVYAIALTALLTPEEITTFSVNGPDVFPATGSVWVEGELISYSAKSYLLGITTFTGLTRGTKGTSANEHFSGTKVFSIFGQLILNSGTAIWNAVSSPADYIDNGHAVICPGGLWYSDTPEALFLKNGPGSTS